MSDEKTITVSEITDWLSCRLKHKFAYRDLIDEGSNGIYSKRDFGVDMHKWIAMTHMGIDGTLILKDVKHRYNTLLSECETSGGVVVVHDEYDNILRYKGMAMGFLAIRYYNDLYCKSPLPENFSYIEEVFNLEIPHADNKEGFRFAGRIDGIFHENVDSLYELKTTGWPLSDVYIHQLRTSWQPKVYSLASKLLYGVDIKQVYHEVLYTNIRLTRKGMTDDEYMDTIYKKVLSAPEKYRVVLSDDFYRLDRMQITNFLYNMAKEIYEAKNIYANPSIVACQRCGHLNECMAYSEGDDISSFPLIERKAVKHMELQ